MFFAAACAGKEQDSFSEEEAKSLRAGCSFGRGATPAETIGSELPQGDRIPIDHFILLMQENRSFDHYFGKMPGIEGLPEDAANPDSNGNLVSAYHESVYCVVDTLHGWNDSHIQYNDAAMDGFVVTNDPDGRRAMGYFDESDLPFYWDLYRTFAMSDQHYCSVLGPTWLNRFYYLSATSAGSLGPELVPFPEKGVSPYVIFQLLDQGGIEWRIYEGSFAFAEGAYPKYLLKHADQVRGFDQFVADVKKGDLPPVTYVDPSWYVDDEHPPSNPQEGQAMIAGVVEEVMASSLWPTSAIILTYDEHGGFYDHVAPPSACHPDQIPPDLGEKDMLADFDRLGFRVPLVAVSPFAKPNYVSHEITDLTSVLRLLELRFGLPALSARDANAWPLLDLFDFENPAFLDPPTLADAPIDSAHAQECDELF